MKRVTRLGGDVKKKSTAKVLRVAAYCRVSTDSDAQLESLDAQKTHYENYINGREDWEFAGLYFDEGISGTKKEKRPALLQMIADCKAGNPPNFFAHKKNRLRWTAYRLHGMIKLL